MQKSKTRSYAFMFGLILIGLILSWMFPNLQQMSFMQTSALHLSEFDMLLNIMGSNTNYFSHNRLMVLYLPVVILGLSFLFFKDKPSYIIRLRSRNAYITKHTCDVLIFSAVFSFLIELVNLIFSFCFFDYEIIDCSGLLLYSAMDLVTQFLFYMRAGLAIIIIGLLTNKKIAPFITFSVFYAEYFLSGYIPLLSSMWLPYMDSFSLPRLITKEMTYSDFSIVVIRGLMLNIPLIIISYYLFSKKDVLNEKE